MNQKHNRDIIAQLKKLQKAQDGWTYIVSLHPYRVDTHTQCYIIEPIEQGTTDDDNRLVVGCYDIVDDDVKPYLDKVDASADERKLATYMWANHQALCDIYCYGEESASAEERCGLLSAISAQLHAIRSLSVKYYRDSLGFSEDYEGDLKQYKLVDREADKAYAELESLADRL